MEVARLIADIVTGLAWPIVILAILLMFREPIREILKARPARLRLGPIEVFFEQLKIEAEAARAAVTDIRHTSTTTDAQTESLPPIIRGQIIEERPMAW